MAAVALSAHFLVPVHSRITKSGQEPLIVAGQMETKAISMKATRCSFVRSKMVCVLQTYMGKEFNVNEQTV